MLSKSNPFAPALSLIGGTLNLLAGTRVAVGTTLLHVTVNTPVQMPALAAGTDYAVYACADGKIVADANFSAPTGYTSANSIKIGGFHYAPGGNASPTAQTGGNTTPAINPCSIWDLKWRPACLDPRGMALHSMGVWGDAYFLNTASDVNGTSKYGATCATGAALPKVPALYGGDGVASETDFSWHTAARILAAFGKRLPTQQEFSALTFGVTEATSVGPQTVTTGLDAPRTSAIGIMQATGNLWVWGQEAAVDPTSTTANAWFADTGGRGQSNIYGVGDLKRAIYGAYWSGGVDAGSRASSWSYAPSVSYSSIGARGVCDHLILV